MPAIRYRPLVAADAQILRTFCYYAIFVPPGYDPPDRSVVDLPTIRPYIEAFGRSGDAGIVALDGDRPVGATWCRLPTKTWRGYGYVADELPELTISLLPEWRGRGIGTGLLERLIDRVRPSAPGMSLSVDPRNRARHLYARFGFREVWRTDESVVMALDWRIQDS